MSRSACLLLALASATVASTNPVAAQKKEGNSASRQCTPEEIEADKSWSAAIRICGRSRVVAAPDRGATVIASKEIEAESGFRVEEFREQFDIEMGRIGYRDRLSDRGCNTGVATACSYSLDSVGLMAGSINGTSRFEGVTIICARDCLIPDLIAAVVGSLRVVSPGLPDGRYTAWLPVAEQAVKTRRDRTIEVGRARAKFSFAKVGGLFVAVMPK